MSPRVIAVDAENHPAISDPRAYLTCAGCIKRELKPIIEALRHHRHGAAKLMVMKLYIRLSDEIDAAVKADQGAKQ